METAAGVGLGHLRRRCSRSLKSFGQKGEIKGSSGSCSVVRVRTLRRGPRFILAMVQHLKVLGKLLWLSVETVVILHEMMRQGGSGNERFVDLLQRLCCGLCTNADYTLLKSKLLRDAAPMKVMNI